MHVSYRSTQPTLITPLNKLRVFSNDQCLIMLYITIRAFENTCYRRKPFECALIIGIIGLVCVIIMTNVSNKISFDVKTVTNCTTFFNGSTYPCVNDGKQIKRQLTFLSLSYHATPVYDMMHTLEPLGVRFA